MINFLAFLDEAATEPSEGLTWIQSVWQSIVTFFTTRYWDILLFFAILVIGIILIKVLLNLSKKLLGKTKMEKITQSFFYNILKFVLYLILILVLFSQIGININGLVTALSAALLAVGMALQNNIANLANGIVIIGTKMFHKGDYISVNGVEGTIQDINFLFTTLYTVDNKKIIMPNSDIVNNAVTNAGANPKRRVDFTFSAAYESDVEAVKKIVTDTMLSNGKVYTDPAPFCRLKTMNSSSLDFFANCWCDSEDYWDVYYYVTENVYNEFKRAGVCVPFNQMEVRMREDEVSLPVIGDALPERTEKIRAEKKKSFDLENFDFTSIGKSGKKSAKKTKKKTTPDKSELSDETVK